MSITREFNSGQDWDGHLGNARLQIIKSCKTKFHPIMPSSDEDGNLNNNTILCTTKQFHFSDNEVLSNLPYPVRVTADEEISG